jgi:hypothetical protein
MARKRGPGKPFTPGNHFGRGRPAGSRNKSTLGWLALLEDEGGSIVRTVIDRAKEGDPTALRLCMERLVPPCKERCISLELPGDVMTAEGTLGALAAVVAALARGEITPGETEATARVLETCRKAVETQELDRRLTELEKRSTDGDEPPGCATGPADQQACAPNAVDRDSMSEKRDEQKSNEIKELRNE